MELLSQTRKVERISKFAGFRLARSKVHTLPHAENKRSVDAEVAGTASTR